MVLNKKTISILFVFLVMMLQPSKQNCEEYTLEKESLTLNYCRGSDIKDNITQTLRTFYDITQITITMTNLHQIPEVICRKENLKKLVLIKNEIKILSKRCFENMKELEYLQVHENFFTHLEDGIFDNLHSLRSVVLSRNKIQTIGDYVFDDPTKQPLLKEIDLSFNEIRNVDSWPWKRGQKEMFVNLGNNKIETFTNNLKWFYTCKNKNRFDPKFEYNLEENPIDHLTNFVFSIFPRLLDFFCFMRQSKDNYIYLNLKNVRIICDCHEYNLISKVKKFRNTYPLTHVRCKEPRHLNYKAVLQVEGEEFQCKLSNESCPKDCLCTQVPANISLIIDCTNAHHTSMPLSIPSLDEPTHLSVSTRYDLRFQKMKIKSIENQSYLKKTKYLSLINNEISTITIDNWKYLSNIKEVYLDSNRLTTLPYFVFGVSAKIEKLSLTNNPWNCACEHKEFKEWLKHISKQLTLVNPNSILCHSPTWLAGRNIFTVEDHEFCQNPFDKQKKRLLLVVLLPISCIFAFFIVSFLLLRRFKVQLNTYLAFHPFDRDECVGEHMDYDVFVSSSFCDRKLAIQLVKLLEDKGYRVCYHEKDFIGGQSITLNICHAVWCSKRVLCIVTNDFLKSHYCLYEFEQALQRNIQLGKKRLIILLDECVLENPLEIPSDFKTFIGSHTYISLILDKSWTNQLLYAMPVNKLSKF